MLTTVVWAAFFWKGGWGEVVELGAVTSKHTELLTGRERHVMRIIMSALNR
jgi:hypothetical protein